MRVLVPGNPSQPSLTFADKVKYDAAPKVATYHYIIQGCSGLQVQTLWCLNSQNNDT